MIVGCEYAGKTTLANEIVKWTERTIGGGGVVVVASTTTSASRRRN